MLCWSIKKKLVKMIKGSLKIRWDKKPVTVEQKIAEEYLYKHIKLVKNLLNGYREEDLLDMSFTPKPLEGMFFTYEIRYNSNSGCYNIIIWKGLRSGDTSSLLYGKLEQELI